MSLNGFITSTVAAVLAFAIPDGSVAQVRMKASLAVGGSSSQIVLLAMNVARSKGFIREEGLDLEVTDFGSGAKGLQALVGRNVDMTIGVYEHTIRMQAKGMDIRSVVLHSSAPGIAIAITRQFATKYKDPKDLKGARIGVSAPGSATHLLLNQFLVQNGLQPNDVSVLGIGNTAGAVAAIRTGGELQAIVNYDPVITELAMAGDIKLFGRAATKTKEGSLLTLWHANDVQARLPSANERLFTKQGRQFAGLVFPNDRPRIFNDAT